MFTLLLVWLLCVGNLVEPAEIAGEFATRLKGSLVSFNNNNVLGINVIYLPVLARTHRKSASVKEGVFCRNMLVHTDAYF